MKKQANTEIEWKLSARKWKHCTLTKLKSLRLVRRTPWIESVLANLSSKKPLILIDSKF